MIRSALLCLLLCGGLSLSAQEATLYAQSIQTALAGTTRGLEVLVLDLRTQQVLANSFAHPAKAIPMGSLLKPFVALAYAQTHADAMPTVVCHGQPDRCWKPGGHGALTLTEAVAQSCNAYFLALARELGAAGKASIPYLPPPPADATAESLIGLNAEWPMPPEQLARAYGALLAAPDTAVHHQILAGMRASAEHGTASRIGHHPGGVLAKTGTAPCVDKLCRTSGEGLALAAVPAVHPTLLLLVRQRGTNGATAAAAASRILTQLAALHAQ